MCAFEDASQLYWSPNGIRTLGSKLLLGPDDLTKFHWGVGRPKRYEIEWLPKSKGNTNGTGKIDKPRRTRWAKLWRRVFPYQT